jgi:hypothetical protein
MSPREDRWSESVMSDLLPCPKCGSAHVTPELVRSNGGHRAWTIVCTSCRSRVHGESAALGFEDVVARWNDRRAT